MTTETESRARMQQMVDTDPHGTKAEALLRRLIVLQSSFGMGRMMALAPDIIPPTEYKLCFEVLQTWEFVHVAGSQKYQVSDAVRRILSVDTQAIATLFAYYHARRFMMTIGIKAEWPDIRAALEWALVHQPRDGVDFGFEILRIVETYAASLAEQEDVIGRIYQVAEQLGDTRLQALLMENAASLFYRLKHFPQSQASYQLAVKLYEEIGLVEKPNELRIWLAEAAWKNKDIPTAREAYQQILQSYDPQTPRRHPIEHARMRLKEIALYERDFATALIYAEQIYQTSQPREALLYELAEIYVHLGRDDEARSSFVRSLHWSTTTNLPEIVFLTLWAWGTFEYQRGQQRVGCALCQLAFLNADTYVEALNDDNPEYARGKWSLLRSYRKQLAGMRCEES